LGDMTHQRSERTGRRLGRSRSEDHVRLLKYRPPG
jgi:hypothetical protein